MTDAADSTARHSAPASDSPPAPRSESLRAPSPTNPFGEGGRPGAHDSSLPAADWRARRAERMGEENRAGIRKLSGSMDALAATITAWRAEIAAREEAEAKRAASSGGWVRERLTRLADGLVWLAVLALLAYGAGFHR